VALLSPYRDEILDGYLVYWNRPDEWLERQDLWPNRSLGGEQKISLTGQGSIIFAWIRGDLSCV
jgi:hypothetical protein